jgi:2-polyprenyl-3-methyl-5-hydroxy-6-metoxy-1,4-benzoquinol methylase
MPQETPYFTRLAAAYVRGRMGVSTPPSLPADLLDTALEELSEAQLDALIAAGLAAGLRLHRFKRTMGLPRVRKTLGALRGLAPVSLLDVGSGRGAFLWPLLDAFPELPVTPLDLLAHRVADMEAVRAGGVERLHPAQGDATAIPFHDRAFDGVTALEVLEHIPDAGRALAECCRVAQRFIILSCPSGPDDNPEHIHLFDTRDLARQCAAQGFARVTTEQVLNHFILVARRSAP